MPDLLQFIALRARLEDLDGIPIISLNDVPLRGFNSVAEARDRHRDLGAGAAGAGASRCASSRCSIRRTSPGPVFYRQERMGLDGKAFHVCKFRSMHDGRRGRHRPDVGARRRSALHAGRTLLRRCDLDELPQLWNVLRGDMSLVGPRPERPFFVEQFKHRIPQYMLRHKVKAGITGWAQVNGWRGNTSLEKRIEYDLYYIENWSVGLDIKIMWLTLSLFSGVLSSQARATDRVPCLHCHAHCRHHRRGRLHRVAPLRRRCSIAGNRSSASTTCSPATSPTSRTCANRDFTFIKHDVTNYIYVEGPVDCVLHWASPASPIDYLELPIPTLKVGALGTHKALGLAKAKRRALRASPRPPRSTAIRSSTRRRRPTGATSTRSARAACTTRPSASPRR